MVICPELINELLKDINPQALLWENGLLEQLTKALVQCGLEIVKVTLIPALLTTLLNQPNSQNRAVPHPTLPVGRLLIDQFGIAAHPGCSQLSEPAVAEQAIAPAVNPAEVPAEVLVPSNW